MLLLCIGVVAALADVLVLEPVDPNWLPVWDGEEFEPIDDCPELLPDVDPDVPAFEVDEAPVVPDEPDVPEEPEEV